MSKFYIFFLSKRFLIQANAKGRGQHKQKIIMHISLKGIEIVDVDSQVSV